MNALFCFLNQLSKWPEAELIVSSPTILKTEQEVDQEYSSVPDMNQKQVQNKTGNSAYPFDPATDLQHVENENGNSARWKLSPSLLEYCKEQCVPEKAGFQGTVADRIRISRAMLNRILGGTPTTIDTLYFILSDFGVIENNNMFFFQEKIPKNTPKNLPISSEGVTDFLNQYLAPQTIANEAMATFCPDLWSEVNDNPEVLESSEMKRLEQAIAGQDSAVIAACVMKLNEAMIAMHQAQQLLNGGSDRAL